MDTCLLKCFTVQFFLNTPKYHPITKERFKSKHGTVIVIRSLISSLLYQMLFLPYYIIVTDGEVIELRTYIKNLIYCVICMCLGRGGRKGLLLTSKDLWEGHVAM
jgi:hypothetical protein